jgi:hypothetical protein
MNMKMWMVAAAAASVMYMAGAQADTPAPSDKDLVPAVKAFLANHGDLCLAWYNWPRDLTAAEQQTGVNEAVQLPVLERLGIVQSVEIPASIPKDTAAAAIGAVPSAPGSAQLAPAPPTKRYSLTAQGRQYYLQKKRTILNVHSQPEAHDADFCVAHLTLDKVVKWPPPEPVDGHLQTAVLYTYHIKAADWMADPEAQKVFPVVDRIIRGQDKLLMSAPAQLRNGKWVPVMPGQ